jgi:hypothetical protein
MSIDLETATEIAQRVNKRMKDWDMDIEVRTPFVIMMAQVMKEIRREEKRKRQATRSRSAT